MKTKVTQWRAFMAEWSKAVRSGRILSWRGFESHWMHFLHTPQSCHNNKLFYILGSGNVILFRLGNLEDDSSQRIGVPWSLHHTYGSKFEIETLVVLVLQSRFHEFDAVQNQNHNNNKFEYKYTLQNRHIQMCQRCTFLSDFIWVLNSL